MQREGRKPFLAADDLGNLHQVVVHDVGQVVGRQFIGPLPEDLVVQRVGIYLDVTADEVVHHHDGIFRHLETDGPVGGGLQQAGGFFGGQRQGIAQGFARNLVIDEGLFRGLGLGAPCGKFVGRIESRWQ